MKNILVLDTSVASANKGDDIIMECVRKELQFLLNDNFEYTLPTHVSPFHWYQVWRNSYSVQSYANCELKFIGGSNILCKNLLTHYPQWNINWFNCKPLAGSIGVGVGAGAGEQTNWYTRKMYQRVLSHDYYHSVRDERTKDFVESLGLKAINTGCVAMWMLTPDLCKTIPAQKSDRVVFTLTRRAVHYNEDIYDEDDQFLINILKENYDEVFFWPQGINDFKYLHNYRNIEGITILPASKDAYDEFLTNNETDYVGTRLHGGIYAMRHGRRSIIIAIDERAREINKANNLNCLDKHEIRNLHELINSEIKTGITMDFHAINQWKSQFASFRS